MSIVIDGKLAALAKSGDPALVPNAVMEPKLDGHRMLAKVDSAGVRMYARSGVDKSGKLPAIERWLAESILYGTILDGEIIAPNATGGDWAGVQTILGADSKQSTALVYVVFDVLQLMGEDVRLHPLHVRRSFLERMFGGSGGETEGPVTLVAQYPYDSEKVQRLIAGGWEGAIVKDKTGTYRSGRHTGGWIKVKGMETADVVVMGATEGRGKFTGQIGALVFGEYVNGELVERGQCSGMTDAERAYFTEARDVGMTLEGMVIEVRHFGVHPTGGWKSAQFKRIRTDKLPEECAA